MRKLSIKLENCFGIKKLNEEFDFSTKNINAIYARNGLMKTSLAKVFKKIQEDKISEIKDLIFERTPVICEIKIDGNDIQKEDIFVIQSFESSYESDSIASLLINSELKQHLTAVLKLRDKFFKPLEKKSGMKISKTSGGKKVYELEPVLISDFNFNEQSFLININQFNIDEVDYDFSDVQYSTVLNDSALKKIKSNEFQSKINEFLNKSEEVYQEFSFLEKGNFTLPKLKEIKKGLDKNAFFVKDNKVLLHGGLTISNINELNTKINEIESRLQDTNEFKEIEKLLSDVAGRELKDIIENNPGIVEELKIENLDDFRKKLWLSYIKSETTKFEELKQNYLKLEEDIEQTNIEETPWKEALEIFNNRFIVPFNMEISNLKSTIIGESLPKITFSFCKDGNRENLNDDNWVKLNRDELEGKDTLSQGEKRALYLLNIIFDIEKRRRSNQKTLFIIDDIADSFDYKNKYAIVEYLKEISEENNFFMLILSHNFDFYRTVSSRLNMGRGNRYMAFNDAMGVKIEQEYYQKQPFKNWMERLNRKNIIALIPFVRNLIEFGTDKKVNDYSGIDEDYLFLTNLLHQKSVTEYITASHLKKVYKEYIDTDNFMDNIQDTDNISDILINVANSITYNDTRLENKIVLSIAIRLAAEKYMIDQIRQSTSIFNWVENKTSRNGDGNTFLSFINNNSNQTRELYKGYCQIGNRDKMKILDNVNTMTPESIHLNSFMYEPILDMDIIELKNLYDNVVGL
jgi:energy-coupling factor transporter ATP-binding protein EcfA2